MENNKKIIEYSIQDGILYSTVLEKINVDINVEKRFIELRHEISKGETQYWCYDIKNIRNYTFEARNYAAIYGQDLLHACAVIVHNPVSQFIFNVFLRFKTMTIPIKSFKSKEEAVRWLNQLKQENEGKKGGY
jgi:hypothetical protein